MITNKEIKKYYNVLCNGNYPTFINKYLKVKELQRLKGIGQFCGCDYNKFYNIKYWYSRYDHSLAVALITWHFTKNKTQTLAALFHDLGTPAFSHCIDFMLGDSIHQESSELSVKNIIINSPEIMNFLKEDKVSVTNVTDLTKYPIIENKSPKLCADRLEGVLHTVLIWLNIWSLKDVEKVYRSIIVLKNEESKLELGFKNIASGEFFSKAVFEYSMALQNSKNKFTMQYTADQLRMLINNHIINIEDLYIQSEDYILNLLNLYSETWHIYINAEDIIRNERRPKGNYWVSIESKKRYVIPLCNVNNKSLRIDNVSNKAKKLLDKYNNLKEAKYCYIKGMK